MVSRATPLSIKVFSNGKFIIVENSLQLKEVKEESTNLGLNNIRDRYNYLCGENTVEVSDNGAFKVKIPIIEAEI